MERTTIVRDILANAWDDFWVEINGETLSRFDALMKYFDKEVTEWRIDMYDAEVPDDLTIIIKLKEEEEEKED